MNTKQLKTFLKNNSGTILMAVSVIGTIATTYFGIKGGMETAEILSNDDYKKKDVVKACLPAVASCGVSIACALAGDAINRKQKNDLLAMAALIGSSYSGYRREVINRYGEEVDKEITDTVARNCERIYMAPDIPDKLCHWIIDMCDDGISTYEIDAYERDIIHAEMHFNRNYILGGWQSVANLFEFLGVDTIPFGDEEKYGWAINDSEIYYIDFEHEKIDENTFRLYPVFSPWYDYENLDMFGDEY